MLPMPDTLTHSQTTEYRATQLVSSIKHKLSHAISKYAPDERIEGNFASAKNLPTSTSLAYAAVGVGDADFGVGAYADVEPGDTDVGIGACADTGS